MTTYLAADALVTVTGGNRLVNVFAPMLRRAVIDDVLERGSRAHVWRFEPNFLGRALGVTGRQLSEVPPKLNVRFFRDYKGYYGDGQERAIYRAGR